MSEIKPPYYANAFRWWQSLNGEGANPRPDPGGLARLRRAVGPTQAWSESATRDLYRQLGFGEADRDTRMEAVGVLAIVLAHVRADTGRVELGTKLGEGEQKVLSDLRLRRLAGARDASETLRGFREAVALLRGTVPIVSLTESVLGWLDDDRRDRVRTHFLFAYHGAADAAP